MFVSYVKITQRFTDEGDSMLMDSELLTTYKKALNNDAEATMKIADAYKFGEGVPQDHEIAHKWYEKLIAFKDLPYVEYEYCYILAARAARDRQDYTLAFERYKESLRLFIQRFGVDEGFAKMDEIDFLDEYYRIRLLAESNC